jgi:D-alanyl-D-alanine carboxypeptidase
MRPKARPEVLIAPQLAEAEGPVAPEPEQTLPEETRVAEAAPELVMTDPGNEPAVEATATLMSDVSAVETVAGATTMPPPALALADAAAVAPMPKRQAPIFDAVQADAATEPGAAAEEQVVVVMSTSGGRHFGVHVGEFPSRYDAEKALLKTALAESATLNEGRRDTTQSGGIWHASFMGLTEEQAELACRRLTARAIPCETVGG